MIWILNVLHDLTYRSTLLSLAPHLTLCCCGLCVNVTDSIQFRLLPCSDFYVKVARVLIRHMTNMLNKHQINVKGCTFERGLKFSHSSLTSYPLHHSMFALISQGLKDQQPVSQKYLKGNIIVTLISCSLLYLQDDSGPRKII